MVKKSLKQQVIQTSSEMNNWLSMVKKKLHVSDETSVNELLAMLVENDRTKSIEVAKKKITNWEEFFDMLDIAFPIHSDYTELLDEPIFEFENFVPDEKHNIGEGAWIKVPTKQGFNVYFAKPAKKKFDKDGVARKIQRLEKEADSVAINALETIAASKGKVDLIKKELDLRKQIIDLNKELMMIQMFDKIDMFPYTIKYQVSKTKWITVYPYQYELASDIENFVQTIIQIGKTPALTYKALFTGRTPDAVFYLQSRGISKDVAIMMAKLRDCFFIFDTRHALQQVYGRMTIKAA